MKYTSEDDAVLTRLYPTSGAKAVHAVMPHHSLSSIGHRAAYIGVHSDMAVRFPKKFKPETIQAAIVAIRQEADGEQLSYTTLTRLVAQRVGCSESTVKSHMQAERRREIANAPAAPLTNYGAKLYGDPSLPEGRVVILRAKHVLAMGPVETLCIMSPALVFADSIVMHPSAAPAVREFLARDRKRRTEKKRTKS